MARNPVPRTFDSVFAAVKPETVPLAYMRALAEAESALNPRSKTGRHFGLFQISPPFLADVNKKEGTSFSHNQMLDPRHNAFVWSRYYEHFIKPVLQRHVKENWSSADWPRLVTAAHNSGIGAVDRALKAAKAAKAPLTHAEVFKRPTSREKDADVLTDKKRRFQRAVAALFQREQGSGAPPRLTESPDRGTSPGKFGGGGASSTFERSGDPGGGALLLLILILALSES